MEFTRRSFLSRTGVAAGVLGTAGCISTGPGSKFRFKSYDVVAEREADSLGEAYLIEDPIDIRANLDIDYSATYKQTLLEELFETGTVSPVQWQIARMSPLGSKARTYPTFLLRNGTYFRVTITDMTTIERKWWTFGLNLIDESPPDDANVATEPFDSLSPLDSKIVQRAMENVFAASDSPTDRRGKPFHSLSVWFHEDVPTGESKLVPSPPFEYVRYTDQYNDRYFKPVAEKGPVPVTRRTFSVEPVVESKAAFESHARDTLPAAEFSEVSISTGAERILDEAIDGSEGFAYEETPPLSDDLEEVLEHLGIADHLRPHDSYDEWTDFNDVIAEYEGQWYEFTLLVYP